LSEWRLHEALVALDQAEWASDTPQQLSRLKAHYRRALTAYETIYQQQVEQVRACRHSLGKFEDLLLPPLVQGKQSAPELVDGAK
jgi:hypothetical protein